MTNEELYKDEVEKIMKEDDTRHPAVRNGKPVSCIGMSCRDCDLHKPNSDAGCSAYYRDWLKSEAEPDKPKQERMVTRTVSYAKGEEVVYYNILYGFGRQDVLEKLYNYEQEEEEKMEKDEIKVGDTVKVTMKNRMREGATGTVRTINRAKNGIKFYHVHFDGESSLYVFYEHEIEKVKSKKTPPRIVVYRDGDTVTVKDLETGETASAVCSKDDTFDLHTGAFIAMSRLTHFDTDIRLMRLEMEQLNSYISDIKMRFGAFMGEGYKYPDFDEEEV